MQWKQKANVFASGFNRGCFSILHLQILQREKYRFLKWQCSKYATHSVRGIFFLFSFFIFLLTWILKHRQCFLFILLSFQTIRSCNSFAFCLKDRGRKGNKRTTMLNPDKNRSHYDRWKLWVEIEVNLFACVFTILQYIHRRFFSSRQLFVLRF